MLLFSSALKLQDWVSREDFLGAVFEWNETNPYEENRIPGICWNGEAAGVYGSEELWMQVSEYRDGEIAAVRFEKVAGDGVIWDTDYVADFREKRLAIQLNRSYREDAVVSEGDFSTPYFISLLIRKGFLAEDGLLPVTDRLVPVDEGMLGHLLGLARRQVECRIPVVFVSRTIYGTEPVDAKKLAYRLKGVAHVLVQEDRGDNQRILSEAGELLGINGDVTVIFPNEGAGIRRFRFRMYTGSDSVLMERVIQAVIRYGNVLRLDELSTWQGVQNAILADRLSGQRAKHDETMAALKKAVQEVDEVYGTFDEELRELQRQVEELTRKNEALRYENYGLRGKLSAAEAVPVLVAGEEVDFYPGEIREFLRDILTDALRTSTKEKSRKADLIRDLLEHNPGNGQREERQAKLKGLLQGYSHFTPGIRQGLAELGFEISEDGKHYKLVYHGDPRYQATAAKTPSDHRDGKNLSQIIINGML